MKNTLVTAAKNVGLPVYVSILAIGLGFLGMLGLFVAGIVTLWLSITVSKDNTLQN